MDYDWHVFISHASEDKADVARPLADHFVRSGMKVWLDETEIKVGDSIWEKVNLGLRNSAYGIAIISPSFVSKKWTRAEIDGLFNLETIDRKRILPVWHNISRDDVAEFSPILAGRLAGDTNKGLTSVFHSLVEAMGDEVISAKDDGWPYYSGRITKKVLMDAPEGYIAVSNDPVPMVLEPLGSVADRELLWARLKGLRISQNRFYIFKSMKGYRQHVESQRQMHYG